MLDDLENCPEITRKKTCATRHRGFSRAKAYRFYVEASKKIRDTGVRAFCAPIMLKQLLLPAVCLALLFPLAGELHAATTPETFSVHFALNSAELSSSAAAEVAALASYLRQHPQAGIAIGGHTDSSGPQELNRRLSRTRASAVRQELIKQHKVAPQRLSITWLASSQAIADNRTEAGRAENRRAEIVFSGPLKNLTTGQPTVQKPVIVRRPTRNHPPRRTTVRPKPSPRPRALQKSTGSAAKGVLQIDFIQGGDFITPSTLNKLDDLATELKQNPNLEAKVTGLLAGGSRDSATLRGLRTRIEQVRNTLIYGHNVPAAQVTSGWDSGNQAATRVEVRTK